MPLSVSLLIPSYLLLSLSFKAKEFLKDILTILNNHVSAKLAVE